jgi:pyruvate/2-oxoglutarate dehydrogenase complex dihydrolipoamide dehydrogenase (E3) component
LLDKFNIEMFDNVRPLKWVDPKVDGNNKYDILVIGAGAGGLVTAAGSAGLGARACMIERFMIGGDCLVNGCVPSKAFLKACNVAKTVRTCEDYGISFSGEVKFDFQKLMGTMKHKRGIISHHDSARRFTDKYGVDVYLGHAKFISPSEVSING